MKKPTLLGIVILAYFIIAGTGGNALALESETELLLKLLETKGVISDGEATQFREDIQNANNPKAYPRQESPSSKDHFHSIRSISDRVEKLEQDLKIGAPGALSDKVKIGVLLEVEANGERMKTNATGSASTSDILLATAALTLDVRANNYVAGRAVLQYEEGVEEDHVFVDEGIVFLSGKENCPYAVKAGRMYVPFGHFESHFVSDPITLTLGETRDTALVAEYGSEIFSLALGGFKGDGRKTSKSDNINVYLASLGLNIPKDMLPNLKISAGVSYISSISESNSLRDTTSSEGLAAATITNYVPGHSAFVSAAFLDNFFIDFEYLSATKKFKPGELAFDNGESLRPQAWNLELAWAISDPLELAARYEGSRDYGVQPEQQMGLAVLYKVLDNTSVTLEYLTGRYANDNKRNRIACQLSVIF